MRKIDTALDDGTNALMPIGKKSLKLGLTRDIHHLVLEDLAAFCQAAAENELVTSS